MKLKIEWLDGSTSEEDRPELDVKSDIELEECALNDYVRQGRIYSARRVQAVRNGKIVAEATYDKRDCL